jgi:hypothetical protein
MRGSDERSGELLSYVDIEDRVPAGHPLRLIRRIVNEVLAALDSEFTKLYADSGRPSIAPERLLRASAAGVLHDPLGTTADGVAAVPSENKKPRRSGASLWYGWHRTHVVPTSA